MIIMGMMIFDDDDDDCHKGRWQKARPRLGASLGGEG